MKKLMIAAAIVCVAVASQAAVSLSWGADYILDNGGNNLAAGTSCYLVDATIYTALFTDTAAGKFDTTSAGIMANTTTKYNSGDENAFISFGLDAINGDTWSAKQNVNMYTVFVTDGYVGISQYAATEKVLPADNNLYTANFGELSSEMGESYVTWTATAVPEPTSGLLLLLGVAGLALRRRRA